MVPTKQGISIHPPREGRDWDTGLGVKSTGISIHPPRVGRDICITGKNLLAHISIHPPRVGRDDVFGSDTQEAVKFQSTLPREGRDV